MALSNTDCGTTVEEVEAHLKTHEAFQNLVAQQVGDFLSVLRTTSILGIQIITMVAFSVKFDNYLLNSN